MQNSSDFLAEAEAAFSVPKVKKTGTNKAAAQKKQPTSIQPTKAPDRTKAKGEPRNADAVAA